MPTPIPSSEASDCPNCGQYVGDAKTDFCPFCGAALKSSPLFVFGLKIFGAICLGLLTLLLGAAGACFLVFSDVPEVKGDLDMTGIAAALFLAAALCIWGFVKLVKH